jgi:hypothetical protein
LAAQLADRTHLPFDFVVVDEAQDVSVAQLRFLAALGASQPNCLFFAGDLGQRIFQPPFSWKALGVDIRGRSRTLYINYRYKGSTWFDTVVLAGITVTFTSLYRQRQHGGGAKVLRL